MTRRRRVGRDRGEGSRPGSTVLLAAALAAADLALGLPAALASDAIAVPKEQAGARVDSDDRSP